jgi:hypothetical protein
MEQYGEFGQKEYSETFTDLQESLVQLNFQLVRTNISQLYILENRMREIVKILKEKNNNELLGVLFKMTLHVRDIFEGKGECLLFYMMILVWYEFYPEWAAVALNASVIAYTGKKALGSWKDIKYFCNYCRDITGNESHPMIEHAIYITNEELKNEYTKQNGEELKSKSFVAKWIPREKSKKFSWIFKKLALNYFSSYVKPDAVKWKKIKASNKAFMEYRFILSSLNKELDTVQIKQCKQIMSKIDYSKVSSVTLIKEKRYFLNLTLDGKTERSTHPNSIFGAEKFKSFISSNELISGKNISLGQFAKKALQHNSQLEQDLINKQWIDNATQIKAISSMIPILDCSQQMIESGVIYDAMALACRIAEESVIGKRILCFSSKPVWVNFETDECDRSFTSMIELLNNRIKDIIGLNSNFHGALDALLDTIVECELSLETVESMILVIVSTMKIEKDSNGWSNNVLYKMIKHKYYSAGESMNGTPYSPPHILFWNVSQANGFPCLSYQKNVSMFSGFSSLQLNSFRYKETNELKICTPWSVLCSMLNKKRYNAIKTIVFDFYLEKKE